MAATSAPASYPSDSDSNANRVSHHPVSQHAHFTYRQYRGEHRRLDAQGTPIAHGEAGKDLISSGETDTTVTWRLLRWFRTQGPADTVVRLPRVAAWLAPVAVRVAAAARDGTPAGTEPAAPAERAAYDRHRRRCERTRCCWHRYQDGGRQRRRRRNRQRRRNGRQYDRHRRRYGRTDADGGADAATATTPDGSTATCSPPKSTGGIVARAIFARFGMCSGYDFTYTDLTGNRPSAWRRTVSA